MRRALLILWGLLALAVPSAAQAPASPTLVPVGEGATDAGTHQLVRTSGNILWVVPFDCETGYPFCGRNRVRAYRANRPGVPTKFREVDAAHSPRGLIKGSAVAIDGQDRLHVVWIDGKGQGTIGYNTFDTVAGLWGQAITLMVTNWTDGIFTQGIQGVSIALDAAAAPHVVMMARPSTNDPIRVYYTNAIGGAFTPPRPLDDQAVPSNPRFSYHPTLAFTPANELLAAWIQGSCTITRASTCYTPDGVIYTRLRTPDGRWRRTVSIDDPTFPSIDNGPSLLVTSDGVRHITFTSARPGQENQIRYWYDSGQGWKGDRQPAPQVTHDPVLGPDGAGGLYIYGHGAPADDYAGFGPDKLFFYKPAGATAWGPWTLYAAGPYDDATSTRWSQFFHNFPEYLDITVWGASPPYRVLVGTERAPGAGAR
jgi:hypothetical protein